MGSDPEDRSPVDFGFDESVWCPRTADEVLWTMFREYGDFAAVAPASAGHNRLLIGWLSKLHAYFKPDVVSFECLLRVNLRQPFQ